MAAIHRRWHEHRHLQCGRLCAHCRQHRLGGRGQRGRERLGCDDRGLPVQLLWWHWHGLRPVLVPAWRYVHDCRVLAGVRVSRRLPVLLVQRWRRHRTVLLLQPPARHGRLEQRWRLRHEPRRWPAHVRALDRGRQPVCVHPQARLRDAFRCAHQRQRAVPARLRPVPVGHTPKQRRALQRAAVLSDVLLPAGPVGATRAARASQLARCATASTGHATATPNAALPTQHGAGKCGLDANHLWFQLQGHRDHSRQPLLYDAHQRAGQPQRHEQ